MRDRRVSLTMSKYKALWHGTLVRTIEFGLDMLVMLFSLFTVVQINLLLRNGQLPNYETLVATYWQGKWIFVAGYMVIAALMFKIYNTSVIFKTYTSTMKNIVLALFFTNAILILVAFILGNGESYIFNPPLYAFAVVGIELVIFTVFKFFMFLIFSKYNKQTVIIIGPKHEVDALAKQFLINKDHFKCVKFLVYFEPGQDKVKKSLYKYIDLVDCVYVTQSLARTAKDEILNYASFIHYKQVFIVPEKYEITMMGSQLDRVDDTMVLKSENMHLSFEMRFLKRTIDLVVSTLGLLIMAVPMLIVALIVKLQDGGSVFYRQKRFKRNNKPFYILKFRSMTEKQTEADEQQKATATDARITPFGKFIRATRLDELPQLINVFKGEMSLVGPRPLMESDINKGLSENPDFRFRSNVKPGVTGLAQIYGRNDTSTTERLRYDLMYVRRCSLWLDIKIVFQTFVVIMSREAGLGRTKDNTFDELLTKEKKSLQKLDVKDYELYEIIDQETK